MKKKILSKTKLRISGAEETAHLNPRGARIEEIFPEVPEDVDRILFDVTGESLFPRESHPIPPVFPLLDPKK
jgi:hypothetical protein